MKKNVCFLLVLMMAVCALFGCGKKNAGGADGAYKNDVKVADLEAAVAKAYGEAYLPSMELDSTMLQDMMGVEEGLYEEAIGKVPMIIVQVDTLVIVKAKDGKVEDVQKALQAYRQTLVDDQRQYPMNVPKIQASEVVTYGNYVCYIMLGTAEDMTADEEALLKEYQELNQKAKDTIEGMLK